MPCGISFRDPKADKGADISKVINAGRGPMTTKNPNLLKIISSPFYILFS